MAKRILIFSDGMGQFGGLSPDQRLSNIYKLYRATRPATDTGIDPAEQVAFYDAGLGTGENGADWKKKISRIFGSAFGTGISDNIVDCYEAILKFYQPGDRIYLFGFSRGAYTARCVANVLNLCGVPSVMPGGAAVPKGGQALRNLAQEAVFEVYEHGSGKPRKDYEDEREKKARRFRAKYDCCGTGMKGEEQGNVASYFIGVFDTVASLGTARATTLIAFGLLLSITLAIVMKMVSDSWFIAGIFALPALWIATKFIGTLRRQRKVIYDWPKQGQKRSHFAAWRTKNYDRFLDTNVRHARQACAIDENRAHFPIAGWANSEDVKMMDGLSPPWLRQTWFAGNHSDIGGSHPEDESRLSDIALRWMIEQLEELEHPVQIDCSKLSIWPDPLGIQHDELRAFKETFWPSWMPEGLRFSWPKEPRDINPEAELHPSVYQRLDASDVVNYDRSTPYRPEALRHHVLAGRRYSGSK